MRCIKLYVNGDEASDILIGGGTFKNNEALESGGVIAVWGATGLVTITGGTFSNNSAMRVFLGLNCHEGLRKAPLLQALLPL